MFGNLIYIEKDSPDARKHGASHFEQLYLDAKKKQMRQEEMRRQKLLIEMNEELQLENSNPLKKQSNLYSSQNANDFYERNKQWSQMVKQKNYTQRQQQNENRSFTPTISTSKIPPNYVGPIKGWQSRFEEHINKKMNQTSYNENSFRPSINKKSEEICSKMFNDEPVESRLLKYGLDVRNKRDYVKQQVNFLQNVDIQQNFFKPTINNQGNGDDRPFYDRLYEYAAIYEHKKIEQIEEYENQDRNPEIIKLPKDMEERVNNFRQQHPLYEVKQGSDMEKSDDNDQKKYLTPEQLDQFLKRNYILPPEKGRPDNYLSKEDEQLRECSFKPYINPLSKEIVKQKFQGDVIERNQKQLEMKMKQLDEQRKIQEEEVMKECSFQPNIDADPFRQMRQKEIEEKKKKKEMADKLKEIRKEKSKVPQLFDQKGDISNRSFENTKQSSPKKKEKQKVKFGENQNLNQNTSKSGTSTNQGLYNLNSLLRKSDANPLNGNLSSQFDKVEKQIENLFECIEQNK